LISDAVPGRVRVDRYKVVTVSIVVRKYSVGFCVPTRVVDAHEIPVIEVTEVAIKHMSREFRSFIVIDANEWRSRRIR